MFLLILIQHFSVVVYLSGDLFVFFEHLIVFFFENLHLLPQTDVLGPQVGQFFQEGLRGVGRRDSV